MSKRRNVPGGVAAVAWLIFVMVPVISVVTTAFSRDYRTGGMTSIASGLTTENLQRVLADGFLDVVRNTFLVTALVVGLTLVVGVPLGFFLVRSDTRMSRGVFRVFLFGLAVPAQAVVVPLYFMMSQSGLYDTYAAIVLPTTAFALPVAVLVLAAGMREIPRELYEAMQLDGAGTVGTFTRLVVPLARSSIGTVAVFAALQAWNGFLFPLILTQSEEKTVVTLGLFRYLTRYGADVPALFSAVLLSGVPVLLIYLFARRSLVRGLAGTGGK